MEAEREEGTTSAASTTPFGSTDVSIIAAQYSEKRALWEHAPAITLQTARACTEGGVVREWAQKTPEAARASGV